MPTWKRSKKNSGSKKRDRRLGALARLEENLISEQKDLSNNENELEKINHKEKDFKADIKDLRSKQSIEYSLTQYPKRITRIKKEIGILKEKTK